MTFTPDQLDGGTLERGEDSTHVVTLWMVPGGWNYHEAVPMNVFFSDGDTATKFTTLHQNPPSMAKMDIITHEDLVAERYQRMFGG